MTEEKNWMKEDAHAFLRRGRMPYARAILEGRDGSSVHGELSFYDTPAGVMVLAEVEGLPRKKSVYGFCFCGESCEGNYGVTRLCRAMPLIYDRNGVGHCSMVSESLRRFTLSGRRIALKESAAPSLCFSKVLAEGTIT